MKWYIFSKILMDERYPEGFLLTKNLKFYIPGEKLSELIDEMTGKQEEPVLHKLKDGSRVWFHTFMHYMTNVIYKGDSSISAFIEYIRKSQETKESNAFCICNERGIVYEPMDWIKEQGLIKEELEITPPVPMPVSFEEFSNKWREQELKDLDSTKIDLYARIVLQELPTKYDEVTKLIILHEAVYLLTQRIKGDKEVPFDVLKDANETERRLNGAF